MRTKPGRKVVGVGGEDKADGVRTRVPYGREEKGVE